MIPVKNIYYMLSYAFQILKTGKFKKLEVEKFENAQDMFSAVLLTGTKSLIQQGIKREYVERSEPLSAPKGKLHLSSSIKDGTLQKRQVVCVHDEFTEDCYFNQILKTTFTMLLAENLPAKRKKDIRFVLGYFANVGTLDPSRIQWRRRDIRLNHISKMLLAVCELTIKGLLQSQKEGEKASVEFLDEQKESRLYERFILEYFRKEHPELKVSASEIPWQLDDGFTELLPVMRSDIMLEKGNQVLIIDAKYYRNNLQSHFDHRTIHSANLYQIFTYVKNKDVQVRLKDGVVSGLLLYAKTDASIQPDQVYQMSGNTIGVKNLDLSVPFADIAAQLDHIAETFLE